MLLPVKVHRASSGNRPLLARSMRAACISRPRRAHQQRGIGARATWIHSALRIDAWHQSLYRTWSCLRDFDVSLTSRRRPRRRRQCGCVMCAHVRRRLERLSFGMSIRRAERKNDLNNNDLTIFDSDFWPQIYFL